MHKLSELEEIDIKKNKANFIGIYSHIVKNTNLPYLTKSNYHFFCDNFCINLLLYIYIYYSMKSYRGGDIVCSLVVIMVIIIAFGIASVLDVFRIILQK